MATFLLEVGTEELPADFARLVVPQLEKMVCHDLIQKKLRYGLIKCTSTPRRIVLVIEGVADFADDSEEEYKGPPASNAFENGSPTKAALGFAKRFAIDPCELEIRETVKGPFVFAKVLERGLSTSDLLSEMIPEWIGNIQGRRFMRWGVGEKRFSRPVRWLVALLDEAVIPVCIEGTDPEVSSGNLSRGHRLSSENVFISSADEYFTTLSAAGIKVDRSERKNFIRKLVQDAARELEVVPDLSEDLLDELTDLVEFPSIIRGEFEKSFLELPTEVLCTVMRVHQRYIPLYLDKTSIDPLLLDATKTLSPKFLCVSNGLSTAKEIIQIGNERVLRARLADAEFFVNADLSTTSADRCEELSRVTFSEGLGTLLDRVKRIEWLSLALLELINISSLEIRNVQRAACLCKHDLVTQIVGEFPELQGVMGGKYLLADGEAREVSLAVLEHYLPRGAGDDLPHSDGGAVLALAERIELLLSIFSKGERPTGSSDPYALRRAGNGILQIIWDKGWQINLKELFEKAIDHWIVILPGLDINKAKIFGDLSDFFRQRLISLLEELHIDIDLVHAVAGETISIERLLSDPEDVFLRASLLVDMRNSNELSAVQAVVTRASRLAAKGSLDPDILSSADVVDPDLFEKSSERNMLNVLNSLEPIVMSNSSERYKLLAEGLAAGSDVLSAFFDGDQSVMVMTDNEIVRTNRLNLLRILCNQASLLADFNQIQS